jgi:uncharacterized protein YbaA (DUF1428 family)
MTYLDGFVIAVPDANRQAFIDHASSLDPIFVGLGATRVVEAWEDDVPDGKRTDFRRAVAGEPGERVVFSWIEWPDKAARDAGWARMMAENLMGDEPMPFDGARIVYGGFTPVVEIGS